MKKKLLYAAIPVLGLSFLTAGIASAHGMWGGGLSADDIASAQQAMFQRQAALVGVDVDTIKNGWAQGKTLQEIAQENGLTQEQFQQKMIQAHQDALQERLQALVGKGVITQEQANQRFDVLKSRPHAPPVGSQNNFRWGAHVPD